MDLAINGAGFFQVTDGNSPVACTRATASSRSTATAIIVNNQLQKLLGYPASADRRDPARRGVSRSRCRPPASRRAKTGQIDMEFNLDCAARPSPRRHPRRGDRLRRPDHLQQRHLDDASTTTKGQDVALTYYFQKAATDTVERVRDRQRHDDRGDRWRQPRPRRRRSTFPPNGSAPDRAGRRRSRINIPAVDQRRRRGRRCRIPDSIDLIVTSCDAVRHRASA